MRAAVTGDAAQQKDAQEKAAQALAKAQNIPVDQARTQVAQYVQQFNDTVAKTKEQAKQAADAAARVGSQGALYGALALILGALAAFFAGRGAAVDPVLTRTAVAPRPSAGSDSERPRRRRAAYLRAQNEPAAGVAVGEETVLPLIAETAHIDKRAVETGRVRVSTRTETVDELLRENLRSDMVGVTPGGHQPGPCRGRDAPGGP